MDEGTTNDGPVDRFEVDVEESDAGWIVVGHVDGDRRVFGDPHPDRERAEFYAKQVRDGAGRWDGAGEIRPT